MAVSHVGNGTEWDGNEVWPLDLASSQNGAAPGSWRWPPSGHADLAVDFLQVASQAFTPSPMTLAWSCQLDLPSPDSNPDSFQTGVLLTTTQ